MLGRGVKVHPVFVRLFHLLMLIFHFWLSSAFSNVWRGCQSQQRLQTKFSSPKVAPVMFVRTSFMKAWKSSEQTRLTDKRLSSLITTGNFQTCATVTAAANSVASGHNSRTQQHFWQLLRTTMHYRQNTVGVGGTEPVVHWKLVPDTLLGPEPPVADHWDWMQKPTLVSYYPSLTNSATLRLVINVNKLKGN